MEEYESFEFDASLIKALDHDIRRKILLEIFENGVGGYSELTRVLQLKSGVFYHHMRLLEEANLVQQLRDKTYDITPKGVHSIEIFSNNFLSVTESKLDQQFELYNPISNLINSHPLPSIIFQAILIILGLLWLNFSQQIGLIGYFIISIDHPFFPIVSSLTFFFINLVLLDGYFMLIIKRSLRKMAFLGQILLPQTILVLTLSFLSFIPPIALIWTLGSFFGLVLTLIFQIFSLTYYIHILRKIKVRSFDKALIGIVLLQYWNLLLLYVLF